MLLLFSIFLVAFSSNCPASVSNQQQLVSLSLPCFNQLYDPSRFDGNKITRIVNQRLQTYRRMLQQLKMQDWQHVKTTPVVKWAQNSTHIFIGFKLSHRQDSPTCSDIRSEAFSTVAVNETQGNIQYTTQENSQSSVSTFNYRGECYFTAQKMLFTLDLTFQGKLSKAVLRKEGLGQYTLVVQKQQPGIWMNPFTNVKKAGIWTQLRAKYSSDMDNYFQRLQGESSTSSKGKRRRRPKQDQKVQQVKQQGFKNDL